MARLWCREDGGHEVKVPGLHLKRSECWCPEHPDSQLGELPKKRKPLGRGKTTSHSVAYARAHDHFNRVVTANRCFFIDRNEAGERRRPNHRCDYPIDAHHLVPKDFINQQFGDLPEDEYLAILFDPRIGCPLCRKGHGEVEIKVAQGAYVYWDELEDDCVEFCEAVDRRYADVPLPSGSKRKSMLERLKEESPEREAVA